MINKEITKAVIGTVSGMSVSYVAGMAIKAVIPAGLSVGAKVLVGVGSFVIGGIVAEKADKFMRNYVEEVYSGIETLKDIIEFDRNLKEEA